MKQYLAYGVILWHVQSKQRYKQVFSQVNAGLEYLQYNVQYSIRIQVKTTFKQKTQT